MENPEKPYHTDSLSSQIPETPACYVPKDLRLAEAIARLADDNIKIFWANFDPTNESTNGINRLNDLAARLLEALN